MGRTAVLLRADCTGTGVSSLHLVQQLRASGPPTHLDSSSVHHTRYTVSNAASGNERKAYMTDSKPPEPRAEQEHQQRDAASEENSELSNSKPEDRDEKGQEEGYERTWYQVLLFVGGIALFGLVLGLILDWYIDPQNSTQKKDLVQALGLITAGVAGAVGIFFTWRGQERNQRNTQEQFRLTRQSQDQNQKSTQEQLENAQEELRLTRQGQMTERFTQAIEQLGSEKLELKLGGIYSLERTAQEEKNYHWPVMEVLTSYVRRHAARNLKKEFDFNLGKENLDKELWENDATPAPDIQAILDVIGRRSEDYRTDKEGEYGTIELIDTDLRGANLQEANLQEANLKGANLQEANLQEANLKGALLPVALLEEANLQGANLQEAILQGANFHRANLHKANLQGAILHRADLQEAGGITEDQIQWTLGSNETELPEDLNPPELWSKSLEEQERIVREHFGGGSLLHRYSVRNWNF
jgi:uncharacterized protein YjbI with pentapeptide repeats